METHYLKITKARQNTLYKKAKLLEGKRFNEFKILKVYKHKKAFKSGRARACLVQCSCGNKLIHSLTLIQRGTPSRCNKCRAKYVGNKHRLNSHRAGKNRVLARYKSMAKKRGLSWNLSNNFAINLFEAECFYCGTKGSMHYTEKNNDWAYNGIDRKNNKLGYSESNCVSCCKLCNRTKWTLSDKEFIDLAKTIAKRF